MSAFEDVLRGTMSQQNRGFEQADADLRAETIASSAGIENLTDKRGALCLGPPQEQDSGVWYELLLLFRPAESGETKQYTLGTFFVPWKGYPIRTGHGLELPDRRAIAAYFVEMARNPTSALVNYLAFNLRRQGQPVAGG
jgi:hypothetical protein